MGWFKQLRLLLWKNFLVQYRRKLSTVFEILLPIFFVFILLILRITTIKSDHHDAEGWPPFQLNRTIPIDKAHIQQASPPYAIDKWTIAFAPNSSETNQIMSKLSLFLDANIRAFESADKMVRAVVTDEEYQIQAQTFLCGVSFTSVDSSAGVAYDLRFPTSARSTYGGKRLQKFLNIPQHYPAEVVHAVRLPYLLRRYQSQERIQIGGRATSVLPRGISIGSACGRHGYNQNKGSRRGVQ